MSPYRASSAEGTRNFSLMHLVTGALGKQPGRYSTMKHATAIAQLEIHASNCENNAVIQEREGQYEEAANSRSNAAEYRQAIEALQAA
ncbi:hypothetical protein F8N49_03505 [Pseudomonas sp. GXM4]|uniref:hypothetical protein n=1 Tax=Pseudomonas sp. GXM4 TaxID=2651867 RepID=UPI00124DA9A6|nr:hypothetical protein [Pseudomonas sp. GXM4]KAB2527456.1 hypothetical protein F8N49_03505 [Pseudomonas sp. GXM4]